MNDKIFENIDGLRKFLEHAKVADCLYNPSGPILFLLDEVRRLEIRINSIRTDVDHINGDDD